MNLHLLPSAAIALFSFATALQLSGEQASASATTAFTSRLVVGEASPDRRVTPDGRYVLFAAPGAPPSQYGCQGVNCDNLWLEDETTHKRTWIAVRNSGLSAGWSPDGNAFYVQDRQASDVGILTLYKNNGERLLVVGDAVLRVDPAARELFYDSHHYFEAVRWIDGTHLLVRFDGHTDYYPSRCFDLKYSVSLDGKVKKLSTRVGRASAVNCNF
jgi:hypothetical protein